MHPYLQVEPPVMMAHRGFSRQGLENTMPAFAAAVDLGLTHIETDVHATRDGHLVAFHDASLDRITDRTGQIADLDWAVVAAARVVGPRGDATAGAGVPLMEDVLGSWPDLRVNIDVKDWRAVGPLTDVVRRTSALHRVCVTSFDDRRTAAVRRALGPGLATSPGRAGVTRWWLKSLVPRAGRARHDGSVAVQVPSSAGPVRILTRAGVDLAHRQGRQVHVWTVNDAPQMHRLLDLGVDGLISDRADLLVDVVAARRRSSGAP